MNEFAESRSRSFTTLWQVAPEYRIVDGHVCALVDEQPVQHSAVHPAQGRRTYLPMARPELPAEFAKAATGKESDVLAFVGTYGLLGYELEVLGTRLIQLVGAPEPEPDPKGDGDPLTWILAHAKTVQLVLELLGLLDVDEHARGNAASSFLESLKVQDGDYETINYLAARRGCFYPTQHMRPTTAAEGHRVLALNIVADVLNENSAGGVSRELLVEPQEDGQQGFTAMFTFRNLLDCVYWHLADAASGGWVRRCGNPECGAFFVTKSARVKYCPPPMGHLGVSPCMNRCKQRKYRENLKTKPRARQ